LEVDGMHKHIGQIIEIIYLDRSGKFSQRKIEVLAINGGFLRAFCLENKAPRSFRIENIMAVQSVRMVAYG
jgi:predicted DNA-binding transcriptional regulator YafY